MLVPHAGVLQPVYVPRVTGPDAFKTRALRNMLELAAPARMSVYDRIEASRDAIAHPRQRIGGRPWYYFPKATGTTAPGTQVMHSRACTDRKNGADYGRESTTAQIAFHDFDAMTHAVPGMRLVFCKVCRRYVDRREASAPGELLDANALVLAMYAMTIQRH